MLINLESFGNQLNAFVSVYDNSLQRVFTAYPFNGSFVDDAAIASGFLWCVKSDHGDKSGSGEVCQIDLNTGDVLARKSHSIVQAKLTLAPQTGILLIYGIGAIVGFRAAPFGPVWAINGAFGKKTDGSWLGKRVTHQLFDDRDMSALNSKRSGDDLLCVGVPVEESDGSVRIALLPRTSSFRKSAKVDFWLKIDPQNGAYEIERSSWRLCQQVVADPPIIPSMLKPIEYKSIALPVLSFRDIEAYLIGLTRLKSWKKASVSEGLLELAAKIKKGIEGVSRSDGCEFIFSVGDSLMDEWVFFEELKSNNVDVLHEVQVVLEAWLDALETSGRTFPSTDMDDDRAAGPMTGALAYLESAGELTSDILRRFTLLRVGEHEAYSRDVLLTEYIAQQPLASNETIALKVFLVFLKERDGRISFSEDSHGWNKLGILDSAKQNMSSSDFVDLVQGEISYFEKETTRSSDNPKVWSGPITGLRKLLDPSIQWDRDVAARLSAAEVTQQ